MAWYGEFLILLPQYPARFASSGGNDWEGAVFALAKNQILVYLTGQQTDPLQPIPIQFSDRAVVEQIGGFEGYEAIGFSGDRVFLTIETHAGKPMLSYLVSGTILPDLSEIQLDPDSLVPLPPPVNLINRGDEALSVTSDAVLTLFEINSERMVPDPTAHRYNLASGKLDRIPLENILHRLADATPADKDGRFWAINSYSPDESLLRTILEILGLPNSTVSEEVASQLVERLIELEYDGSRITLSGRPPLNLELAANGERRNWEALARLEGRGFLLMTDKVPESILAFVSLP